MSRAFNTFKQLLILQGEFYILYFEFKIKSLFVLSTLVKSREKYIFAQTTKNSIYLVTAFLFLHKSA